MTAARKAQALESALGNLRMGESVVTTALYLMHVYPPDVAYEIAYLAGRLMDCDPDYERNYCAECGQVGCNC